MFELGKMNQYFKYFFNSKNKKVPVNIEAKDSATGKANQTPFIPINFGKIYIKMMMPVGISVVQRLYL